jgi:hypothetical protein
VTASGYPRAGGGGGGGGGANPLETGHHLLSPSVFTSCSTLSFNFSFACFWLAVRLSLDKKLNREDPNSMIHLNVNFHMVFDFQSEFFYVVL